MEDQAAVPRGHYQTCHQEGEEASPDQGDSRVPADIAAALAERAAARLDPI
jgi:hypothetical protein